MTPTQLQDNLKAYLLNPFIKRFWRGPTPAITNYADNEDYESKNTTGINIETIDIEKSESSALSGRVTNYDLHTIRLTFYTRDLGSQSAFLRNQRNINTIFNRRRNNYFVGAQLVKLKNNTTDWELENVRNDTDNYNIFGGDTHPELSKGIDYYGYRVKNENGDHFLYRKPQTLFSQESWNILDLNTHLTFPVSRFTNGFVELIHGGDTFPYEFETTRLFTGKQFISYFGSITEYKERGYDFGDVIKSESTIQIRDYDVTTEEREMGPIFETVVAPSHPYSPVVQNNKYVFSAANNDPIFHMSDWDSGTRAKNTFEITPPAISNGDYLAFGSTSPLKGIQEKDNVFGNVFAAFNSAGVAMSNGICFYSYVSKNTYFANANPRAYVLTEDEAFADKIIVSYFITPTQPQAGQFLFTGEESIDPTRNNWEININANNAYVALAFSAGQILRIMDGSTNRRGEFLPRIDQPFIQRVIRNTIYNIYVSQVPYSTVTDWRIFF